MTTPDPRWDEIEAAIRTAYPRATIYPEQVRALDALASLCAEYERMAKWILNSDVKNSKDAACAECLPYSDLIKPGFRCGYHTARAALAAKENE